MLISWRVFPLVLAGLATMLLCAGCNAGPTFRADGRGNAQIANAATSTTTWNDESGSVTSSFQGTPPAMMDLGAGSAWMSSPGPHRVLSINQSEDGVALTLADPADTNFKGLSVTLPDGTTVGLQEFSSSASAVIAAYNEQVIAALEAQQVITQEQGQTLRAAIAAGQTLGEALANIGLQAVLPVPKKRAPQPTPVPAIGPSDGGALPWGQLGSGGLVAGAILLAVKMLAKNFDQMQTAEGNRLTDHLKLINDTAKIQQETIRESRALVSDLVAAKMRG